MRCARGKHCITLCTGTSNLGLHSCRRRTGQLLANDRTRRGRGNTPSRAEQLSAGREAKRVPEGLAASAKSGWSRLRAAFPAPASKRRSAGMCVFVQRAEQRKHSGVRRSRSSISGTERTVRPFASGPCDARQAAVEGAGEADEQ